jgi:hypothetical protein
MRVYLQHSTAQGQGCDWGAVIHQQPTIAGRGENVEGGTASGGLDEIGLGAMGDVEVEAGCCWAGGGGQKNYRLMASWGG